MTWHHQRRQKYKNSYYFAIDNVSCHSAESKGDHLRQATGNGDPMHDVRKEQG